MYKVTIEVDVPKSEGDRYVGMRTIYSQSFEELDVQAVIAVANRLNKPVDAIAQSQADHYNRPLYGASNV